MARNYTFSIDEYYHVYNRGVEKRKIFLTRADHERFKFLLYICNNLNSITVRDYRGLTSVKRYSFPRKDTLVDIGAYCLMPNHFHLLLREKREGGISLFLQKLTTAYTMYFNDVYERQGGLFQGSFKASHVNEDRYLEYLYSYIHLNPTKLIEPNWKEGGVKNNKRVKEFLSEYTHSSYLDYISIDRPEKSILNTDVFPGYFLDGTSFSSLLNRWVETKNTTEV